MSLVTPANKFKNIQENHDMSPTNHITIDPLDIYYIDQIKNIRHTMPWIIFSLGMLGNLLILLVFMKKKRRSSATGFCFITLAISDILALFFMLLGSLLTLKIVGNKAATCKVIRYFYHVTLQLSSWSLVLLTIDRLIAVCFIFRYDTWCKKWFPQKIFAAMALLIACINLHLLIFIDAGVYEVERTDTLKKNYWQMITTTTTPKPRFSQVHSCYVDPFDHPIYFQYIYSYWDVFHAIIYGILPFLIIFSSNLAIIIKLSKLGKQKLQRTSSQSLPPNPSARKRFTSTDTTRRSPQVTIMLLSVAFVFLLFTSPISVYMAAIFDHITHVRKSRRELVKSILKYIAYFNNAVNFYIYISLSSEFRREFVKTLVACFSTKDLVTCTKSTDLPVYKEETKPGPRTRPIIRKPLAFKRPEDRTEEAFLERNSSTRSGTSYDSVEIYKKATRKAPLVHFNKNPRWSIPEKNEDTEEEVDFYNKQQQQQYLDSEDDYEYRESLIDYNDNEKNIASNDYDYNYLVQDDEQDVQAVVNHRPIPDTNNRKYVPRNQLSTIFERDSFSEDSRQTLYTAQPIEILPVRYEKKISQDLAKDSLPVKYQQSLNTDPGASIQGYQRVPVNGLKEKRQQSSPASQTQRKQVVPSRNYQRLPPRKEKMSINNYATEV